MNEPVIAVQNLKKHFGDFEAVKGISFEVKRGTLFAFLGPNGAGKTTTISMLTTQLGPTGGTATIAGFDLATDPDEIRKRIGIIFQDPSLDLELTARENLWFHGVLYGVPAPELKERIPSLIAMVGLTEFLDRPVKTFSGGMKRRLEIARGLIHTPDILFLDEPTLGLDAQTRQSIWDHINELREKFNMTIFLTTHYLEETERSDQVAIIDHGTIVDIGSPAELKQKYSLPSVEAVFLSLTGKDIRDAQLSALEASRENHRSQKRSHHA